MTLEELQSQHRNLQEEYRLLKAQYEAVQAKLNDLLRRLFGPKSEKIDPAQLQLAIASMQADEALENQEPPVPPAPKPSKPRSPRGGGRRPLPENLPVERVLIDLPAEQREGMTKVREEVSEEIDYRPSQFFRRQYVRPVYVRMDKAGAPLQAAMPKRVIPGGGVGTALIAHVLVSRFCDHLPYYRIEQMAARQGVTLDRQRLSAWTEHAALLLKSVYDQLNTAALQSEYLQVDETPVRVLDPDKERSSRLAWLWAYHSPGAKTVTFDFNLSRGQDSLQSVFAPEWSGIVQADGYGVYPAFFKTHPAVTLVGCWAHVRRAWVKAVDLGGSVVARILAEIQKLYLIEADAKHLPPAERSMMRQARSLLPLATINTLCKEAITTALPSSNVGKAASYTLERWPQLERYAHPGFGQVQIDNNPVERSIRPTALGRKNWLFIGHPDAGWRSAVIYSIVGSCKLVGANPYEYLLWALNRLASSTTATLGSVLPADFLCAVKEQR